MFVYRSLVVGLLGAIALLIAFRSPTPFSPPVDLGRDSVVDARLGGGGVVALLGLIPRERIVAIDDQACVACDQELEARWQRSAAHQYVDVTIATPSGERRVLVLSHPPVTVAQVPATTPSR